MGFQVIGAGFGRTGTASLKVALDRLLNGPCYHMSEAIGQAGHVDYWLDAASGNPDWETIFGNYVASVDFPGACYWRELAKAYPEAKIILSVRDSENWFRSTQETIFSQAMQDTRAGTKWGRMIKATITDHIGGDPNDKERVIEAFEAHNKKLKETFGPERLLVFQARHGWGPLCQFLGVPEPETDYPYINSKEEFSAVIGLLNTPIGQKAMNGEGMNSQTAHQDLFKKDNPKP